MTGRTNVDRAVLVISLAIVIPLLVGMASFGTCAGTSYPLTLDVPPRRAPVGIKTITVQDFHPPGWGTGAAQGIRNRLTRDGFVEVRMGGGEAMLRGSVDVGRVRTTHDQNTVRREVEENDRKVVRNFTTYFVRKQLTAGISYELYQGGRLVAGNNLNRTFDETYPGQSRQEATANAPADDDLQGALLSQLVDDVVFDIAPHRETRNLPLMTGVNPDLRTGITYMQKGRMEQAFQIWNGVIQNAENPQDAAAGYYNIGVIREARGELPEAFEMFSKADRLVPGNDTYIDAMTRVETEQKERAALGHVGAGSTSARRLTINVHPSWARIRIMNIVPAYSPGVRLEPGRYDLLVEAPGYRSHRSWIELRDDVSLDVQLDPQ